jgi:DNA-binding NtrC family response regulator
MPSVLIVEDEPLVRLIAAEAISSEDIEALEAEDAETALELLDAHPEVAVLFTDVDMPGMNGIELARRVHEARPGVELIVTSGKQRHLDENLPDHGTFLAKPYEMKKLIELVRRKLRSAGRGREA